MKKIFSMMIIIIFLIPSCSDDGNILNSDEISESEKEMISVSFTDNDITSNISGILTIKHAGNQSDITHYDIHWGNEEHCNISENSFIGQINAKDSILFYDITINSNDLFDQKEILVYPKKITSEIKNCSSIYTPINNNRTTENILAVSSTSPFYFSILELGETISIHPISYSEIQTPTYIQSKFDKFFIIFENGRFITINGNNRRIEKDFFVSNISPYSLAIESMNDVLVTDINTGFVYRVDINKQAITHTVDTNPNNLQDYYARHIIIVGEKLYVIGQLGDEVTPIGAVLSKIDLNSFQVEQQIDLTWRLDGETRQPFNPILPLLYEKQRNRLFISTKGIRHVNSGTTVKVDLDTFEVIPDQFDVSATYNGHKVINEKRQIALILEHTSTPVASTHVRIIDILPDGSFKDRMMPPILDIFHETDELKINQSKDIAILSNTNCWDQTCPEGIGINLFDLKNEVLLPKITAEDIGFVPNLIEFLRK